MMSHMWEAITKKHSSLPNEMVLTQIFRDYKIPIHDEEPQRALRHTNIYNLATLRRMGFHKVNNVWTKKNEQVKGIQNIEEPKDTIEEISGASSPDPPQAT